jgi:hypothetical protein
VSCAGGLYGLVYKGLDLAALLVQLVSLVLWTVQADLVHPWALGLGLALTSCGWWEAYLPYDNALVGRPVFAYLR